MGRVIEDYRHMCTPVFKEVAQIKFASIWILFTPISKEVFQFKIAIIQFEQIIVASYAKSWCLHVFLLLRIQKGETCLSPFLTSCKIVVK